MLKFINSLITKPVLSPVELESLRDWAREHKYIIIPFGNEKLFLVDEEYFIKHAQLPDPILEEYTTPKITGLRLIEIDYRKGKASIIETIDYSQNGENALHLLIKGAASSYFTRKDINLSNQEWAQTYKSWGAHIHSKLSQKLQNPHFYITTLFLPNWLFYIVLTPANEETYKIHMTTLGYTIISLVESSPKVGVFSNIRGFAHVVSNKMTYTAPILEKWQFKSLQQLLDELAVFEHTTRWKWLKQPTKKS